jgi:hypothetical protein
MEKTCPDSHMLSVYFDGEMPSPWKEKLEAHVSGCPDCRKRLETYRLISDASAHTEIPAEAGERVWQRLGLDAGDGVTANEQPSRPEIRRRPIWRRRLSVPLPAIAAAAVLVIVFAFVLTRTTPATGGAPSVAVENGGLPVIGGAESDIPEIFPDLDMASVLQYLNDRDSGDVLIIRLPDSRDFLNYSEPAMIRSADYSPSVRGGRRP